MAVVCAAEREAGFIFQETGALVPVKLPVPVMVRL